VLYDPREVSEEVGLSRITLQSYTSRGKSNLVRSEDFIVCRVSPYRRQLMITERGRRRLLLRAYRVYRDRARGVGSLPYDFRPAPLRGCASEQRMRLKAAILTAARHYLEEHLCAVPACPCSFHLLGAPQADVVHEVMARKWDGVNRYALRKLKGVAAAVRMPRGARVSQLSAER
jgi:hypothetical protein